MDLDEYLDGRVVVKVGDITAETVDAIVNAANSARLGGGGVDGAIHSKGGSAILDACREIRRTDYPNGLPAGEAVITTAGELPAKYVIHTVGPIYGGNKTRDAELIAACYSNSLAIAVEHGLETVAVPAISTGVYGYPKDEAARVASRTISGFLRQNGSPAEVRLVFFSEADARVFIENCRF
jgi:O-acetyl-ADP-ribose deacetylase (regulator of RNase III)